MKLAFTLLLAFWGINALYATNYYTSTDGNINSSSSWVGNSKPSFSKWSGPIDTIFVNNNMTLSGNLSLGGAYIVFVVNSTGSLTMTGSTTLNNSTLIVRDGGELTVGTTFSTSNPSPITVGGIMTVTGKMTVNNSPLTILETGTVIVGGDFSTSNTSSSDIVIAGEFDIAGSVYAIAGEWIVEETGSLNIDGDFTNDTGSMDFTTNGVTTIGGDVSFHSGSFEVGETGYFSADGDKITVGHATISNDGYMAFPNATGGVNTWSGSWDCDGGSGTGSVAFGQDMDCGAICNGGGSGSCASNIPPSPPPPPLPVTWLTVKALEKMGSVEVSWSTASEKNNDYFVIERSIDGEYWLPIGSVEGAGTTNEVTSYSFLDNETVTVLTYYRIKQVDFDGQFDYSKIVALIPGSQASYSDGLYPNPNEGLFYVDLGEEEIVSLSIVTSKGELVVFDYSVLDNLIKIELGSQYAAGFYTATVVTTTGVVQKNFIIK